MIAKPITYPLFRLNAKITPRSAGTFILRADDYRMNGNKYKRIAEGMQVTKIIA